MKSAGIKERPGTSIVTNVSPIKGRLTWEFEGLYKAHSIASVVCDYTASTPEKAITPGVCLTTQPLTYTASITEKAITSEINNPPRSTSILLQVHSDRFKPD